MLKIGPVDGGGAGLRFTSLLLCVYDHLMKFGGCMGKRLGATTSILNELVP